jgi:hypothetical protein
VERECFAAANLVNKIEEGRLAPGVVHTDVKTFPYDSFEDALITSLAGFRANHSPSHPPTSEKQTKTQDTSSRT